MDCDCQKILSMTESSWLMRPLIVINLLPVTVTPLSIDNSFMFRIIFYDKILTQSFYVAPNQIVQHCVMLVVYLSAGFKRVFQPHSSNKTHRIDITTVFERF